MGSLNSTYNITYNKYVNPYQPFGPNYTGPFIHPSVNDFKKDVEDVYKNRTLIQNNIEKMKKFKDKECLGIRKQISKGVFEKKYTYFKYGEIYNMCVNVSKNIHSNLSELVVEDSYNNINFKLI